MIASTASPFKFCRSVIEALGGTLEKDDVTQLDVLTALTIPRRPHRSPRWRAGALRFERVVDKADILSTTSACCGICKHGAVYAADLHLATGVEKPMDIFRRPLAGTYGQDCNITGAHSSRRGYRCAGRIFPGASALAEARGTSP